MRRVPLTVIKGGIDRQQPKGGVRADVLFDLVNAVVTEEFKIVPRPGTVRIASLPAGTVGLTAFGGKYHVFSHQAVDLSALPDFVLDILLHPFDPQVALERIHFAQPYLGALYVVAEFADENVFHYWLQQGEPWQANHEYAAHAFVTPTTPNGFVYRAVRFGNAYQSWAPGVPRTVGDRIEPTTYNEYYYEAVETSGDTPRSAVVEPIWPTTTGERIVENSDATFAAENVSVTPPPPPSPNKPQASTQQKYQF